MNRRHFLRFGLLSAGALPSLHSNFAAKAEPVASVTNPSLSPSAHSTLTPALKFVDVSRDNPKPYTLEGAALEQARLTPETWRCEITAAPFTEEPHTKYAASIAQPLTLKNGKALDLPALMDLGKQHELHFLKAMQC